MTGILTHPALWLTVVGLPLLLALLLPVARLRSPAQLLMPWAAAPALGLALLVSQEVVVELPLLLGMRLGLTSLTRVFLLFTALLWIIAGVYAQSYLAHDAGFRRFCGFYLLTMSGNLGLILARDLVSFYFFFTLMGLAAYGLVIHAGTASVQRAGRIYLILVILGEAFLLPAMLLTTVAAGTYNLEAVPAAVAGAPQRPLIMALLLIGFGIKAGALFLHVWLPLAHPAAPTPASAILSGTMIKAGLLGWLLFLPLGELALPAWGTFCMVAGITAAFYGVVVGLTQSHPKSILAYSSVSQMGLMTVALGVALAVPSALTLALSAIMVYATHHALAKGALFLGVGVADHVSTSRQRLLVGVGLLLAALALAGAPLSSGAVAKTFLKDATYVVSDPWSGRLSLLLQLGAVATTLLMGRFLLAVWPDTRKPAHDLSAGLWLPWSVAVALVAGWVFLLPEELATVAAKTLAFSSLWPVTVGALLVGGGWWLYRRPGMRFRPAIPEGDVLLLVIRLLHALRAGWRTYIMPSWNTVTHRTERSQQRGDVTATLAYLEGRLNAWLVAGTIFMVLVTLALVLVVLV